MSKTSMRRSRIGRDMRPVGGRDAPLGSVSRMMRCRRFGCRHHRPFSWRLAQRVATTLHDASYRRAHVDAYRSSNRWTRRHCRRWTRSGCSIHQTGRLLLQTASVLQVKLHGYRRCRSLGNLGTAMAGPLKRKPLRMRPRLSTWLQSSIERPGRGSCFVNVAWPCLSPGQTQPDHHGRTVPVVYRSSSTRKYRRLQ